MMSNAFPGATGYPGGMTTIDLRRLRAFVAITEEGHITRGR